MDDLEGCDLVDRAVQLLKEVHRALVEGRAEALDLALCRAIEDRTMPLPGRCGVLVELVQAPTVPETLPVVDHEVLRVAVKRDTLRAQSLQLDGVCPRVGGGVNEGERAVE